MGPQMGQPLARDPLGMNPARVAVITDIGLGSAVRKLTKLHSSPLPIVATATCRFAKVNLFADRIVSCCKLQQPLGLTLISNTSPQMSLCRVSISS